MRASVCVVKLNREQQPSSLAAARRAEREDTCFKDVSRRVMKARHNEAERPCSYLQSIEGWWRGGIWGVERNVKMAGDGGARDDARLQRVTEMRADGPPLKWKLNA